MSTGKVLLGVLAGVATGALLGILFAPDKGSVTRKKISKKGEEFADDLKEKFEDFLDNMTEKFENLKEDASDLTGKTKSEPAKADKGAKTAKS